MIHFKLKSRKARQMAEMNYVQVWIGLRVQMHKRCVHYLSNFVIHFEYFFFDFHLYFSLLKRSKFFFTVFVTTTLTEDMNLLYSLHFWVWKKLFYYIKFYFVGYKFVNQMIKRFRINFLSHFSISCLFNWTGNIRESGFIF